MTHFFIFKDMSCPQMQINGSLLRIVAFKVYETIALCSMDVENGKHKKKDVAKIS